MIKQEDYTTWFQGYSKQIVVYVHVIDCTRAVKRDPSLIQTTQHGARSQKSHMKGHVLFESISMKF